MYTHVWHCKGIPNSLITLCTTIIQAAEKKNREYIILHMELVQQPPEQRPERRPAPSQSSCVGSQPCSAPRTAPAETYLHPSSVSRTVHVRKYSTRHGWHAPCMHVRSLYSVAIDGCREVSRSARTRTFSGGDGGVEVDDVGAPVPARG
jgi:hypothetical protein